MSEAKTLPALMLRNAKRIGDKPAIREKEYGIWRTRNWREYAQEVRTLAMGLIALGVRKGQKLSVIGDNRPRLYWSQMSIMCIGGMAVPVYQDAIADELAFVLNHAEITVIVAEDQEQVDKVLSIRDQLPTLKWIIYDNPRGLLEYDDPMVKSYVDVLEIGRQYDSDNTDAFTAAIDGLDEHDVCIVCYTSGTTGDPKGVMLSHRNFISCAKGFVEAENVTAEDDFLSYLPMAWVGDSLYGLCVCQMTGAVSNCPENPETVVRDLRELGPTGIIAPPGIWENMLSTLLVKSANSSRLKKFVFEFFRNVAEKTEDLRTDGKAIPLGLRLQYLAGEVLVYGPVRDQLGLRRARWCLTGGAPLGPDTFRFFRSLGINLKQVYGMTEVSGYVSLQPDDEANPNTVGPVVKGVEIQISEDGEVLVRSEGVFKGYYKNEEASAAAINDDGFFKTGDAGLIDERGHLVIIDRAKDVGKLQDGTLYAPQFIENKLKFSPYIREAVSFGLDQPFICTMIAIDLETVGNWAERQALPYTNYLDLSQKIEVRELIGNEISRINKSLPAQSQIKRFLLLAKALDADDAEITRTRKLRRRFIAEKYEPVINAFYNGLTDVLLNTEVTFEDGRKTTLETQLTILDAA